MGKVGSIINSEIIRLAKREMRKVSIPLKRDVRVLSVGLRRETNWVV